MCVRLLNTTCNMGNNLIAIRNNEGKCLINSSFLMEGSPTIKSKSMGKSFAIKYVFNKMFDFLSIAGKKTD